MEITKPSTSISPQKSQISTCFDTRDDRIGLPILFEVQCYFEQEPKYAHSKELKKISIYMCYANKLFHHT